MTATLPAAPNRRGALAWVALQDAPTPTTTDILPGDKSVDGYLWLTVQTAAAVDAWARLTGLKPKMGPPLSSGTTIYGAGGDIAGWGFRVSAHLRPGQIESLDDATREQLTAITRDGA